MHKAVPINVCGRVKLQSTLWNGGADETGFPLSDTPALSSLMWWSQILPSAPSSWCIHQSIPTMPRSDQNYRRTYTHPKRSRLCYVRGTNPRP